MKRSPWHLSMLYCSNSGVAVFVSIDFYRDDYFLWTIFVILNIEFHEITLCYTLGKNLLANNLEISETSLNNLFNKISGVHFLLLLLDRNAFQRLYALSLTVYRTRIMLYPVTYPFSYLLKYNEWEKFNITNRTHWMY